MAEKVFVTGAAGYIGGSVAALLVKNGYQVKGLTRSEAKAKELESRGIEAVVGELSDVALLSRCCADADIIIDAADSDNALAVETCIAALAGSNKIFIHTSGSSIVSDQANGERSERIFGEDTKFTPDPKKQERVNIDNAVLAAAGKGVRPAVICPCLIYGRGLGVNAESQQVPTLIKQAIKSGIVRCVGRGQNIWSTIHIEDLAELYLAVIKNPPQNGAFFFAENGEVSFHDLAEKIRESLAIEKPVEEWPAEEAIREWGFGAAVFALGSNSRIRGERSRKIGWQPTRASVLDDVPRCCSHFAAFVK